jgi:hypothetical protein
MSRAVCLLLLVLTLPAFSESGGWSDTPQGRQAYAGRLKKDFDAVYDQIPTLSPREEQWLKTEYDDQIAATHQYTKRALAASGTREYSIRVAKTHMLMINNELSALSTGLRPAVEEVHWTRLAELLMDYDFWQAVDDLQTRGVIDNERLKFLGGFHGPTAGAWAQEILTEIVLPYLESRQ